MPLQFDIAGGNLVNIRASGKLNDDDYVDFVPRMEELIKRWGRLRMLFEMAEDFEGWDARGAWDEFRFQARHKKDVKRVAVVGNRTWEHWMSRFSRVFTGADVRFFEHGQGEEARTWIQSSW